MRGRDGGRQRPDELLTLLRQAGARLLATVRGTPGLLLFSLLLGVALWVFVTEEENPTRTDIFPAPISVRAVNVGQLLVTFNCGIERARLKKAGAIARAANNTLSAFERLYVLKSKSELELAQAEAAAAAAAAEVSIMLETVKRCSIIAPYGGRVFELHVRRYQYVSAGTPLMGIMDDSKLELELIVPSKWLVWLKPKALFSVYIEEVERIYDAKVQSIGARIDPVSQSVKIKGRIIGKHTELFAGMGGRATFLQSLRP